MAAKTGLSWILQEAKHLRTKDRNRKDWKAYVAQATAIYKNKKRSGKKLGKTVILEKGETTKSKTKKVVKVKRNKNGTFHKLSTVGNITDGYRYLQNQTYIRRVQALNQELLSENKKLDHLKHLYKMHKDKRPELKKAIDLLRRSIANIKQQISATKSLIK